MPSHRWTPPPTHNRRTFWRVWFCLHVAAGLGLLVMVREALERARGWM